MNWSKYYSDQLSTTQSVTFQSHYRTQVGGGFYTGVRRQQGYGLGGLFAKLGRYIVPLLKPVAKSIGKQVIRSGTRLAGDILDGETPKQALKQNLKRGAKELFQEVVKDRNPRKRKRTSKKTPISKKKRSRKLDIFDS